MRPQVALALIMAIVVLAAIVISDDATKYERWRAAGWDKHQSGPLTGQWYCAREVCDE